IPTFTDSNPIFGAYTRTFTNTFIGSQTFTVDPDTTVTGIASINVGLVPTGLLETSNSWGTVTATYTISGPDGEITSGTLVRDSYNDYLTTVNLTGLPAGDYTISYDVKNVTTANGTALSTPSNNGAFTVDPAVVTVDQTMLNEYEPVVPGAYSVVGDILGNDI